MHVFTQARVLTGHFRSRNKDDIVRSADRRGERSYMLHANFTALIFYKLITTEILHCVDCGNKNFRAFCSRDLDLDPITFMHELNPHPLKTNLIRIP